MVETLNTEKTMKSQITEWWWSLVWATGLALPALPASILFGRTELIAGLWLGCLFGALAMRASIIGRMRSNIR
jgi:hypothetical protein